MSSSPRFRRGTSVIAALVFAAVLGAVALSLNALQSGSTNTSALPAAAAAEDNVAEAAPTTASADGSISTSNSVLGNQQTCTQVKATAAASGQETQPQNITDQLTADDIKTSCNAAVYVTPQPTTPANWKTLPSSYTCVGESGTLTRSSTGNLTEALKPDASVTAGMCSVQNCQIGTNGQPDCSAAVSLKGIDSSTLSGLSFGSAGGQTVSLTPDTATGMISTQDCLGDAADGGFACADVTPQQAQTELQQATGSNFQCSTDPNDSESVLCTTPNTAAPAAPPPAAQAPPAAPVKTAGAGSGLGNTNGLGALTSFLSGLTRGLTSTPCSTTQSPYVGGTGSTLVPEQVVQNGVLTTVYVQQSTSPLGTTQPCQQQTPYGVGSNGVACAAPPAQPECAAGATAEPTSSSGNGCTTGYQCVPTSSTLGQTPTPQISCSPQTADVGESIAISYSCENATDSSGAGFSTNDQLSGSATALIAAPPSGTNTANYGLTCTDNGQTASAQCSVQIDQPAIDLIADPQFVQSGQTASVGWVTSGMQACTISSPQDANFTAANASDQNVNGVAQTDAITGQTEFDLTCTTLGGQTTEASTIVSTGTATSSSATSTADITVSSTADGQTVNHGGTVTVTWSAAATATGDAAAVWLVDLNSEEATALIAGDQSTSGTYSWQIPAVGSTCDSTSYAACASDLVDGDSYGIEVALYTPQDAYIGPPASAPSGSVTPTYTDYGYTATPFTIGQ